MKDVQLVKQLLKKYPQLNDESAYLVVKRLKRARRQGQTGDGIVDKTVNTVVKLYNLAKFKRKDPRDHKLEDGEIHAVFLNKDGALARAQFAGPGTNLLGNLKKIMEKNENNISMTLQDKNFVSDTDKVALAHDIRYQLFGKDKDKVRDADNKFTNKLKSNIKNSKLLDIPRTVVNTLPSLAGVAGKVAAEKVGLIREGSFATGEVEKLSKDDKKLLEDVESHLSMQGYGSKLETAKEYLKSWGIPVATLSTAAILTMFLAMKHRDTHDDTSTPRHAPGFPMKVGGITVHTRAGLEALGKAGDIARERDRAETGERFFAKTSKGKLQRQHRGEGNPKNRPIRKQMKWSEFVKDFAKENKMTYMEAVKAAKKDYQKYKESLK